MSAEMSLESAPPRMIVACVGNIFLGDDGFGVEVARRFANRRQPADVVVADFGIRGVELVYALLDGCDTLVLVDAVARGGPPGTLYLIEPEVPSAGGEVAGAGFGGVAVDAHSLDPAKVLAFARSLGAAPGRVLLVGCEPARPADASGDEGDDCDTMELRMGLSEPVRAAVDGAVAMIDRLIAARCREGAPGTPVGLPE